MLEHRLIIFQYIHAFDRAFRMSELIQKSDWIPVWTRILIVIPVPGLPNPAFLKHYSGSGSNEARLSIYPVSLRIPWFHLGPTPDIASCRSESINVSMVVLDNLLYYSRNLSFGKIRQIRTDRQMNRTLLLSLLARD